MFYIRLSVRRFVEGFAENVHIVLSSHFLFFLSVRFEPLVCFDSFGFKHILFKRNINSIFFLINDAFQSLWLRFYSSYTGQHFISLGLNMFYGKETYTFNKQ